MAAEATALGGLSRLSTLRQVALMAALAGSVALGVTIALWSRTPNYTLLFASLSGRDASEVLEILGREDIPVRVEEGSGAIMVPSSRLHEARLKLAGEGLPRGTDLGFQILERDRAFGTSQFIEQARYHRALEVELARSVSSLENVQSARVHLALPKESSFVRVRKEPSASVLVKLYPGRKLAEGEGDAIAHLVAAAIPNMESSAVRVIDERGRLLTSPEDGSKLGLSRREFELTRELEAAYTERIENILAPILGPEGVRAQVTAELDFTRTEQARETFNPNPEAIRSERVMEEKGRVNLPGGVPGALSNQPPAPAEVPERSGEAPPVEGAQGEAPGGGAGPTRKQAMRNFELDRIVDHTVTPGAAIRRLSVAVVIDDKVSRGADGAVAREPRSPEEIERITNIVKEAIGFDEERGDSVNVVNTAFTQIEVTAEELPPVPLWKQAWVLDLVKQVGGIMLVLLVAFGVLRPTMRNLVTRDLAELEHEQAERERLAAPERQASLEVDGGGAAALTHGQGRGSMDAVRAMVDRDPKRVANVMRAWVDGGG